MWKPKQIEKVAFQRDLIFRTPLASVEAELVLGEPIQALAPSDLVWCCPVALKVAGNPVFLEVAFQNERLGSFMWACYMAQDLLELEEEAREGKFLWAEEFRGTEKVIAESRDVVFGPGRPPHQLTEVEIIAFEKVRSILIECKRNHENQERKHSFFIDELQQFLERWGKEAAKNL